MNLFTALDVSASGLSAERTHLDVISMNLANVKTTRTPEGGPYRPKTVIFESEPLDSPFFREMKSALDREVVGVKARAVVNENRPLKKVYDPSHPDADKDGYVYYPDINVVEEMAKMMTTLRTYEANVSVITTVKTMYNKALEIGR